MKGIFVGLGYLLLLLALGCGGSQPQTSAGQSGAASATPPATPRYPGALP